VHHTYEFVKICTCVTNCSSSPGAESRHCSASSTNHGPLYVYVYIHIYILIFIHVYINTWYKYTNIYILYGNSLPFRVIRKSWPLIYMCMYIYIYIYIYTYIHICKYMIHIHKCIWIIHRCGKSSLFRVIHKLWPLISNTCMSSWHILMCHKMSFLNSYRKSSLFYVIRKVWPVIYIYVYIHIYIYICIYIYI